MTIKKAIKILEDLCNHYDAFSKGWKKKAKSFNNPDMKEIAIMMGDIMERDSRIIKMAMNELMPNRKSSIISNDILSQEMKKEIAKIIKKEIIEYKNNNFLKKTKISVLKKKKPKVI